MDLIKSKHSVSSKREQETHSSPNETIYNGEA